MIDSNDISPNLTPAASAEQVYAANPGSENAAIQSPDPSSAATSKGGAPAGNVNALKHGLRLTKGHVEWANIENDARTFRTALRNAVVDAHGSLTLLADALIQSACRHERRAALAERWLRLQGDALPLSDRINLLAAVSSATDARDKALKALAIDNASDEADPWKSLHVQAPQTPAAASPAAVTQNTSEVAIVAPCEAEKPGGAAA